MMADHKKKMALISSGVPSFLHKDEERYKFFSGVEDEIKAHMLKKHDVMKG